jgi:hypothetical protein
LAASPIPELHDLLERAAAALEDLRVELGLLRAVVGLELRVGVLRVGHRGRF